MKADNFLVGEKCDELELGGVFGLLLFGEPDRGGPVSRILSLEEAGGRYGFGNLHIVVHGRELGVVDLDVFLAVSFNGLRFGQAG